ncbi:sensor protein RstB [Salmonella enterica subsp. enterica]|uniref:Sensor protein RstB n=1 Tax=Salmonella enterica I TaxID=59201 RepID=A0A379W9M3_SALET|nr:sensor protein RstB [Salmonella enterica subsp. enterica]
MDLNLSFDLRVEPLNHYKLDAATTQRLREGDIVALDDQYTFIQRIPRSHYVLAVGPVPYLYFLHQMRLLDIALMALIAFSPRLSCVYLDAPALARNAQARIRRAALWRGSFD